MARVKRDYAYRAPFDGDDDLLFCDQIPSFNIKDSSTGSQPQGHDGKEQGALGQVVIERTLLTLCAHRNS